MRWCFSILQACFGCLTLYRHTIMPLCRSTVSIEADISCCSYVGTVLPRHSFPAGQTHAPRVPSALQGSSEERSFGQSACPVLDDGHPKGSVGCVEGPCCQDMFFCSARFARKCSPKAKTPFPPYPLPARRMLAHRAWRAARGQGERERGSVAPLGKSIFAPQRGH